MKYQRSRFVNNQRKNNRREANILIKGAFDTFLVLGTFALRDEFGFGNKRLERFLDKVKFLLDCYEEGRISSKDMINTIFEETGVKVLK